MFAVSLAVKVDGLSMVLRKGIVASYDSDLYKQKGGFLKDRLNHLTLPIDNQPICRKT